MNEFEEFMTVICHIKKSDYAPERLPESWPT